MKYQKKLVKIIINALLSENIISLRVELNFCQCSDNCFHINYAYVSIKMIVCVYVCVVIRMENWKVSTKNGKVDMQIQGWSVYVNMCKEIRTVYLNVCRYLGCLEK